MRLTPFERQNISEAARWHFGKNCAAYFFASQTRDDLRGGDIDLLIVTGSNQSVEYAKKLAFRSNLKRHIRRSKNDVLFTRPNDNRPIILEAQTQNVGCGSRRMRFTYFANSTCYKTSGR